MSKIVFLSHSSTDKRFVQAVYEKLRETPYKPWMAPQDITPGMSYGGAIIEGIEVCPVFVVFISLSSVMSDNVRNEIEEAHQSKKYILPVFIENLTLDKELKYYLARKQWINVGKDVEQVFSLLLSTLESVIGAVDSLNESKREENEHRGIDVMQEVFKVGNVEFKMIRVEGGTFMMGATSEMKNTDYDEKPIHQVVLSNFCIGETQVTQELWQTIMGDNPSETKGVKNPVENVSWNDCQVFIEKLNRITGKSFRLPTEAEWEFAGRGGNLSRRTEYGGSDMIDEVAWFSDNSGNQTHPVKTKKPNELGIYDMAGNVKEWCQDWYGDYTDLPQTNPTGPRHGNARVIRGGSFIHYASACCLSCRGRVFSDSRVAFLGLRLALSLD